MKCYYSLFEQASGSVQYPKLLELASLHIVTLRARSCHCLGTSPFSPVRLAAARRRLHPFSKFKQIFRYSLFRFGLNIFAREILLMFGLELIIYDGFDDNHNEVTVVVANFICRM